MRKLFRSAVLTASLLLALAACSRQQSAESADATMAESAPAPMAKMASPSEPAPIAQAEPSTEQQLTSSAATYTDSQRKFIRTASAQVRVKDVYSSAQTIEDVVAAHGGFVTKNAIEARVDNTDVHPSGDGRLIELATYTTHADLQVRVPSERTQAFLRAIANQIEFLDRRNFEAADAQFELLRQRLAFSRHQAEQQALGDVTEQGGKLPQKTDAIAARAGAQAARDEALIAQKTFEDQVAFSTIDLSLYQPQRIRRTEQVDVAAILRRETPGFFARLGHSLSLGWYGLLDVVVALSRLWPLWLVLIGGVLLIRRWRAVRRKN